MTIDTISETFRYLVENNQEWESLRKREEWDDVETLKYIKELEVYFKNIAVQNWEFFNVLVD
ncbi:hypothetical protein HYD87_00870 [Mycoplasmopsis bovis]|nr:hypothetical protein HYD87_00870 [Mycoplasmopsis bovis]